MTTLHGDGINFSFFDLLWRKEDGEGEAPLRVPDTVVFKGGLPINWFFTSKNGGSNRDQTMILRKRKTNLTLATIEEVFLDKASSSRGTVGDDDVVAYFIEQRGDDTAKDSCCCKIEYFNPRTLRKLFISFTPVSFVYIAHLYTLTPFVAFSLPQMTSYKMAKRTRVVFYSDLLTHMEVATTHKFELYGHPNSVCKNEDGRSKIYTIHALHSTSERSRLTDPRSTAYRCHFGGRCWLDEYNAFVTKSQSTLLMSCRKIWRQRDEIMTIPFSELQRW